VLLILGTDAAGKDHVAELLICRWRAVGYRVEKRAGGFSAPAVDARSSSERKGRWGRFRERVVFLGLFPLLRPGCPARPGCSWRATGAASTRRTARWWLVSHTAPRLLALVLGQHREGLATLARFPALQRALDAVAPATGAVAVVLDIDPAIRYHRIRRRIESGMVDPFDRYMLDDPERAERIERSLVELATRYLDAAVIENDDLDDDALERALERALCRAAPPVPREAS
jgi:hypothetical protein